MTIISVRSAGKLKIADTECIVYMQVYYCTEIVINK